MAQETPGIANKKLLLVAIVLAVVVVVLYQVQISHIRKASRGQTQWLLQYQVNRQAGDVLADGDIKAVEVDAKLAAGLEGCMTRENKEFPVGRKLTESVRREQWVLWRHVTAPEESNPSAKINRRRVKYSFTVDPEQSPMEELAEGDRVNVYGMFVINRKPLESYLIVKNLKVMEVPSKRKVTVEVTDEMAGTLANIRTNAVGELWITVRNPTEHGADSKIHSQLKNLKAVPS